MWRHLHLLQRVSALIAGVDRIFDMIRTPTNVIGDAVLTLWVSNQEEGMFI